jgi:hypothetical protein
LITAISISGIRQTLRKKALPILPKPLIATLIAITLFPFAYEEMHLF